MEHYSFAYLKALAAARGYIVKAEPLPIKNYDDLRRTETNTERVNRVVAVVVAGNVVLSPYARVVADVVNSAVKKIGWGECWPSSYP